MTDLKGKNRILSIEDDEFISLFLTDVMWIFGSDSNIEFLSAQDTEKGMAIVKNPETRPKLILLDLALPAKSGEKPNPESGLRFLELIKTDPELMDIKILVFSGSKEPPLQERALRLGAEKFLVKGDYLPKELIDIIKNSLNLNAISPSA